MYTPARTLRIAFIAMSGLRACDPELTALGLTLPGFIERNRSIASLPSLGLLTLAGMTPPPHQRRYLEMPDLHLEALPRDVDLVAISSFSAQIKEAYRVAAHYRALGIPVVIGGLHVTALPQEAIANGATAVVGEGESVWLEVLRDAERGRLRSLYTAHGVDFDLAAAPMPAYELLDIARYNRITVQTSRGCPWRCGYCASSIMLTRKYKQKPAARVLAEIDRIRSLWPQPFIEFADDNSFCHRAYWKSLLPEIAKRQIKWFTESDLSIHEDENLLTLMREAGCTEVLIGFESPTTEGLDGLETKCNWKLTRAPQYRAAIQRIQSHGIRVNACFVLGLDGQTTRVFDQVLDFVEDVLPFDVQVTVPTPFPGTPFFAQLQREGRLLAERAWERCTLFDVNFQPTHMSAQELAAGLRRTVVALYSEEATARRRQHFRRLVRDKTAVVV
ncbi:MAG TPA: radical SAM protein [Accumulibacter sp.]|nr:radical SAM protein [Accumulibacter sp.]HND79333.1 radical SAM protein [Accumulibacter sp.]HNE12190.1 radical SAM protein [Accumulibacter sp.]